MKCFGDTRYAVFHDLPTADLTRDRKKPASIPITLPKPNLASVPQLMGGVIAVACSAEVLESLGRVCDWLEGASEVLDR